jgi:hypothetical protein
MPFGRHRGRPLTDLPLDYLSWLVGIAREPLCSAVHAEIERRERGALDGPAVPVGLRNAAVQIVSHGYRECARRAHPDAGGDTESMQAFNAARDALRALLGERA